MTESLTKEERKCTIIRDRERGADGTKGVLLGDIKLLFRSLLYDRRSVVMVALALILQQRQKRGRRRRRGKNGSRERMQTDNATSRRCSVTTKI